MSTTHLRWRRHALIRLLRRPPVRWGLVAACGLFVLWRLTTAIDAAESARRHWGETLAVAVAAVDLSPGDAVSAGSVTWEDVPAGLVPPGHLVVVPDGATARARIDAGEILVAHRLAGVDDGSGPAPGTAVVDVPVPAPPAALAVGDLVDVVATFPVVPGAAPDAEVVASGASVLAVTERTVSLAVRRGDLTAVAHALATGVVVVAVVG